MSVPTSQTQERNKSNLHCRSCLGWPNGSLATAPVLLIHSADPQSRPVMIIVYTHVARPSIRSYFSKYSKTRKPYSLLARLWVWPSGSSMIFCFVVSNSKEILFLIFRNTNPTKVENSLRTVGRFLSNLPPFPRIDQSAAANLVENKAIFLDQNLNDIFALANSFLASLTNKQTASQATSASG